MAYRTVAFLDILGFKKLLRQLGTNALATKYRNATTMALRSIAQATSQINSTAPRLFPQSTHSSPFCEVKIFSDSIILFSLDDTYVSCERLLYFTWRAQQAFLAHDLLVRGGVAFGEIEVDHQNQIYLGDALTNAYELESSQDWSGIAIDDSVENKFPAMASLSRQGKYVTQYDVPLKKAPTKKMPVINWRYELVLEKGTAAYFPVTANTAPDVVTKFNNSLAFAAAQRTAGCYAVNPAVEPLELRTFYIGGTPPPFNHGDHL